jgi:hypothetical protein
MSNVLIGIIGVILFIGLALAGALFLGPRFQAATNDSKASAISQGTAQIARAAELYRLNEGTPFPAGQADALISKQYLKSRPVNPLGDAGHFYDLRSVPGTYDGDAAYVVAGLDVNDKVQVDICNSIDKQANIAAVNGRPPVSAKPTGQQGCFIVAPGGWGGLDGIMIVYHAV